MAMSNPEDLETSEHLFSSENPPRKQLKLDEFIANF